MRSRQGGTGSQRITAQVRPLPSPYLKYNIRRRQVTFNIKEQVLYEEKKDFLPEPVMCNCSDRYVGFAVVFQQGLGFKHYILYSAKRWNHVYMQHGGHESKDLP